MLTDEGEYICPVSTVFGLEPDEVQTLIKSGLKMTDHNREDEGFEVKSSAFKVISLQPLIVIYLIFKHVYFPDTMFHVILQRQSSGD